MSVVGCKFDIVIDVEAIMVVMKAFDKKHYIRSSV